jgi:hypothetical protein
MPRSLALAFRSAVRRSAMAASPRGPWPAVLIRAGPAGLVLYCTGGEVGLTYRDPAPRDAAGLALSAEHLAAYAGAADVPVSLTISDAGPGEARWDDRLGPHRVTFPLLNTEDLPADPKTDTNTAPVAASLLPALDAAARTAAREARRYALHRVQLRGGRGEVVASDGRQLLVQGGFTFPFADDLLVPALPVFGMRELAANADVRLGRTADHLIVAAGGWEVALAVDRSGRYPDVEAAIPHGRPRTHWSVDPRDAAFLAARLGELPGGSAEDAPLTLDLGDIVVVRARSEDGTDVTEFVLERSRAGGLPARYVLDRRSFARALALGFAEFHGFDPARPLVARDGNRRFVLMPLDPNSAVPPGGPAARLRSSDATELITPPAPERRTPVSRTHLNGQADEPADVPTPAGDPLAEAEALRGVLQDAQARLARLAGGLKAVRRQRRALDSALSSLRQLDLP